MIREKFSIISERDICQILFDDRVLFYKRMLWCYIQYVDGVELHTLIQPFDDNLFNIFFDDIVEQLERGTNINDLVINVPHEEKTIIISNKRITT